MKMTTVLVQYLTGDCLNWAIDQIENGHIHSSSDSLVRVLTGAAAYTSDWSKCGHLLDKYASKHWGGASGFRDKLQGAAMTNENMKEAICRVVVKREAGKFVQVPERLFAYHKVGDAVETATDALTGGVQV